MTHQPLKELKLFKTKKNQPLNEIVQVNWVKLIGGLIGLLIGAAIAGLIIIARVGV